jgi:NAD(P)-dependent dehydrogenase (short-subunit alcohol dehydrogenase family)
VADYRKLFDLSGKTAVVLGAASGIGKSSAEALGNLGARVLCADRDRDRGEATAAGIRAAGGSVEAVTADAALAGDVASLASAGKAKLGRVDIAVTTPGLNIRKTILDYSEEDLDRVLSLNIKGTVYFFQAFGRLMRDQGAGSLIACSSVRAVTIEPGLAVYGATKAAIVLLVKGFASEMGPFGVRVNAIAPSIAETALTEPFKQRPDHPQALRSAYRVQSLERGGRSRMRGGVPGLRRGELREREHAVRRRRLGRDRRTADGAHATRAMTSRRFSILASGGG